MSTKARQDVESHKIIQSQSPQQDADDEEVFSDSKSQPSSPIQPSSPASPPGQQSSVAPVNGKRETAVSNGNSSRKDVEDSQGGAKLQATVLQTEESKQTEGILADPGEEHVVVKDLDTGRAVTVQKV
jgi:hypothetical protein